MHYIPFFQNGICILVFVPSRGASLINLKRGSWFLALVRMQLKSKIYCFMLLKDQKYNLHTGFFNAIVERFRNIFPKFFFTQHFGISHYPTNVNCLWHANLICFLFFLFFKKKTLWRNFQLFKGFCFCFSLFTREYVMRKMLMIEFFLIHILTNSFTFWFNVKKLFFLFQVRETIFFVEFFFLWMIEKKHVFHSFTITLTTDCIVDHFMYNA